ncbi:MAG: PD40 domain-containing protein [Acidobacteria bacterium]|nr:PD40 domain-containing protein [Acidobacteriota bacterium]
MTSFPVLEGDYVGQTPPSAAEPAVFAPDIISTAHDERDTAIAPDGDEFYYTQLGPSFPVIMMVKRQNGRWLPPTVASFSGCYGDLEPCFAADGQRLYFVSNRPLAGQSEPKDYDIWYVERSTGDWGKPVNPGAPLNTDRNEFYPSLTADGQLIFCASHDGGLGGEDLYLTRYFEGAWSVPANLGANVNTAADDYNPFIAADGSYIIYTSHGWGAGQGSGDLWISFRNADGTWRQAINMGARVNSSSFDYCPKVTPDGRYLFFTSNRSPYPTFTKTPVDYPTLVDRLSRCRNGRHDLYWMPAVVIEELRTASTGMAR